MRLSKSECSEIYWALERWLILNDENTKRFLQIERIIEKLGYQGEELYLAMLKHKKPE